LRVQFEMLLIPCCVCAVIEGFWDLGVCRQ
jgi:hypothetical protein